ncbi:hypothetical protein RB597_009041 [Gaeumannomyces tritici]
MPLAYEQQKEPLKKGKSIKSAFESESYDADWTIHVEGLVGSATISPSGRDVALASPEGLAIIDLDSPYSPPRRLSSRGLPWLVVDVQWSPFAARDYWVASTANHRCLVWNLNFRDDSASGPIEHSLQGHSRAITDINFSAHHPDLLATCAVDGYVHNWDLRRPRQPALSFCDWTAGATQVKYSRQDPFTLASSHDRLLHIWDNRKPTEPVKTLTAHSSKIYGLDWNRTRPTALVTCSLDKSIKFWDYSRDGEELERVIRTGFPVWRARHTPFGWGVLAMPQNEPGHLHLYDGRCDGDVPHDDRAVPVAIFDAHGSHKAKEFLWRGRGGVDDAGLDSRDFQLVSWGEDKELRLQRVEDDVLASVGYRKGQPAPSGLIITRKGATYKTFRTVDDGVHRERRSATMSDPRPSSSNLVRRSALTTGIRTPYYKTVTKWRPPSMKAKTTSKDADRGLAQIGWMRGVTMNKRKAPFEPPKREGSLTKDGSIFESDYQDSEWAEPETIQDEFVRISSQLPNVKWGDIDMDRLVINASLKGPWGVGGESIFIKVNVDIPSAYPKTKPPKFLIEKSSFMADETHAKLEREVQELASRLVQCKKNCLDAAFSYLLGEVDLETSTTLFRNVRDLDDDISGIADESSSDDDDDGEIPPGGSASMSQELPEVTAGGAEIPTVLGGGFRQTVIPVKRTCGARFSNDGKLACFFPSKEEKAKLLFVSAESAKEKTKGEPRFAGFGRLAHDSPPPRQRHRDEEASATEDASGGSGDSDGSSSSSSTDSEIETANRISFWYRPGRKFRKTWSTNDGSVRSSGGGTGTGTCTGTGLGIGRRRGVRSKNIVSVRDMRNLLPSKREFAQEYAIFGNGTEVCEHNARVAEKYGYHDLVDIWRYSALLLRSDIPLRLAEQAPRRRSVLVIARDAVSRFHQSATTDDGGFLGTVKWGRHPLAHDFITDLFDYFERLADIQMLAMLSCIFGASSAEDSVAYAESHLTQPQTPLPMKAPSFSLEYFPTNPELWQNWQKNKSQASSAITTPRTSHTPNVYSSSVNSEEAGVWTGDAESNSHSCGEPSPLHLRSGREHPGETDQTQSLSTSPSSRAFRRANSAVASALAASLPRTLQGMVSSSPPEPPPATRKRPSPAEAIFGGFGPAVTWGASTVFGASSTDVTAPPSTRAPSIVEERRSKDEAVMATLIAVDVSVKLCNERQFDDDGWMMAPFLEPDRSTLYASYRYAYAEMLQIWGQPLARLEIMKFNVLNGDGAGLENSGLFSLDDNDSDGGGGSFHENIHITRKGATGSTGTSSPTLLVGKREYLEAVLTSGRGLDVTGICRIHETNLESLQSTGRPLPRHFGSTLGATAPSSHASSSATPVGPSGASVSAGSGTMRDGGGPAAMTTIGGAVGTCDRCHTLQAQLRCVFCAEPVAALYPACLGCGCPSHESCLGEWHAAGERMCPAGDECDCAAEASRGTVESWTAIQSALAAARAVSASYHHNQHLAAGEGGGAGRATKRGAGGGRVVRINTGAPEARVKVHGPPPASPNVARPRRRSTPGHIPFGGSGGGGGGGGGSWARTEGESAVVADVGGGGGGAVARDVLAMATAAAAAASPLGGGSDDTDREGWEKIAPGAHLPSASSAGPAFGPHPQPSAPSSGPPGARMSMDGGPGSLSPTADGGGPSRLLGHPSVAAAHLSRLKRQVGDLGRPSILRQRSGVVPPKKGA